MMCDSHAHDRELLVKWCVNCHSIVMIQRRAVEDRVYMCVHDIKLHSLRQQTSKQGAATFIVRAWPGIYETWCGVMQASLG